MEQERRGDYPKILETLSDIKAEMAKIAAMVEERNTTALLWRGDVCKKFDKIFTWLENLPCKERATMYKDLNMILRLIWGAIGITFALLVVHLGWR